MLLTSLDYPDRARWRAEDDYSPVVARALQHAFRLLKAAPADVTRYAQVYDALVAQLIWPMSLRQQMLILYMLGNAAMAVGDAELALDLYSDAYEIAERSLADPFAAARLAFLRGTAASWLMEYDNAADDLVLSLRWLDRPSVAGTGGLTTERLTVLADLAGFEFMLNHHDAAMKCVAAARSLFSGASRTSPAPAYVHWVGALVARWRGDPVTASVHAEEALVRLGRFGLSASYGRLQGVIAEIELDLVESASDEQTRESHLQRAISMCDQAHDNCRRSTDPGGVGLALLAQTRIGRLANLPINAQRTIEEVITQAHRDGDYVLTGQGYTSLGFELRRQGRLDASLNCFRTTLSVLEAVDGPAMQMWARRELLRHEHALNQG